MVSEIAAIFGMRGSRPEPKRRMFAALGEWPHDYRETWEDEASGIAACVLRTTPESFETSQPLANQDATIIVAIDGFLTNPEELRRELLARGAVLRSRADEELVLWAYEYWGEQCAGRIEGDNPGWA